MNRPRRSKEELRRMILDAGRSILDVEGLETGSTNVTFKRVFDLIELQTGERITNASVIRRIWENQADFQTDVLMEVASEGSRPEAGVAIDALADILASLDLSSRESRALALREVCRVGGNSSTYAIRDSTVWQLWISAMAMAVGSTSTEQKAKIKAAVSTGYDGVTRFWGEQFQIIIQFLGYRLREPLTLHDLVLTVVAYSEGCSLRQRSTDATDVLILPTGPDDQEQEWTVFALGLEGLVHQFLEPDPERIG